MSALDTDLAQIIDNLDRRLHRAEQIVTGPSVVGFNPASGGPFPNGITFGPGSPILSVVPADQVTGFSVTTGAYYDDIFADVSWTEAATGVDAVSFDVELSEKNGSVYTLINIFNTAATNYRFTGLQPDQEYGVRVVPVTILGLRPIQPAYTDFTTGIDTTVPPAVGTPTLGRGATTVVVKYTPLTRAQAQDVADGHGIYEIEVDTNNTFTNPAGQRRIMRSSDQIVSFSDVIGVYSWYGRVRAIDSSGNVGAWSAVAGPVTAGAVDDYMIANLDAAKITTGYLSASRIQAGTLSVGVLTTSTLTSANILLNGGAINVGNPPTSGLSINSQGIRGYIGGTLSFTLDSAGSLGFAYGTIFGSIITATEYNWDGGKIDSYGMRILVPNTGWNPTFALSFVDNYSPFTPRSVIWAPNANSFYIQKTSSVGSMFLCSNTVSILNHNGDYTLFQMLWSDYTAINNTVNCNAYFHAAGVSGTVKAFTIDHPLMPDSHFLHHACLEGPEIGVYYRGRAKISASGMKRIALPSYFEALTLDEDRTVLLTPIAVPPRKASVLSATYPVNGSFEVYGDKGEEFFWEVKAVRSDVGRLEVEIDKLELRGALDFIHQTGEIETQRNESAMANINDREKQNKRERRERDAARARYAAGA